MNRMVIIIIVAVLAVAIIGGGVFFFIISNQEPKEVEIVYFEHEMAEMYTNIDHPTKILKFQMVVEYTQEGFDAEIIKQNSKIMNNVIEIFRRKSEEDTTKASFQERVREEIREMLIEILGVDGEIITNVYFKDFIFQ